jgi:hypothetical protein
MPDFDSTPERETEANTTTTTMTTATAPQSSVGLSWQTEVGTTAFCAAFGAVAGGGGSHLYNRLFNSARYSRFEMLQRAKSNAGSLGLGVAYLHGCDRALQVAGVEDRYVRDVITGCSSALLLKGPGSAGASAPQRFASAWISCGAGAIGVTLADAVFVAATRARPSPKSTR